MPTSKHVAYDPCRTVLANLWSLSRRISRELGDDSGLDWLASALPNVWTGDRGVYNLVRFVDSYLPRRNPDFLHGLYGIDLYERIQLHWAYKWPTWRRKFADPDMLAVHSGASWDGGTLPPCCYPSAPEPHVWSEPGFLLPEGDLLRYVREAPSGSPRT